MRVHAASLAVSLLLLPAGCGPIRAPESQEQLRQRYETSLAQGRDCLAGGQYDRAVEAFQEAVRCRPDSAEGQALLGFSYLKEKRNGPAEQALRKAIALDPGQVSAWCNLGALEVRNRHYAPARDCLLRATRLDPAFAPAQYSLGNVLMHLGEFAQARQALEAAFRLDPSLASLPASGTVGFPEGSMTVDTCLGYARILAATGHAEDACRFLEKARQLGFKDWASLLAEKDFEPVRENPRIRAYLD